MKKQSAFAALLKSAGLVALFLGCQFVASFLAEIAIVIALILQGQGIDTVMEATMGMVYEITLLSGLIFFGIVFLIYKKSLPAAAGMKKTPPASVFAGGFLGFGSFLGASLLIAVTSLLPAVQQSQDAYMDQYEAILSANPNFFIELLYICLIGPFLEELLCRGLIQNTLKKSMKPAAAIFWSALIFGLVHGNLYQMVFTLPLGLLLGYLAHRFDSIWPSVALHIAFNASNYPVQICLKMGYGEESAVTVFVYAAFTLFSLFAIPVGLILLKSALGKKEPPAPVFIPAEAPAPTPFSQTQTPYYGGQTMAAPEFLIVGLGNPGDKYTENRHNAGFMALDYIALRENIQIKNLRFKALTGETVIGGKKVLLLKPQTFMNLSGEAVREAAAFYKIPPEKILVIFDDINFAPGMFRIRGKGSAGGHNGIKSIINCLGSDAFPRIKVGVGAPPAGWELMHWVLGNPSPEDQKKIISSLEDVYSTVKLFTVGNLDHAAALYNGKMHE